MKDMEQKKFRIHGDNIIECERILNFILDNLEVVEKTYSLVSPSVIRFDLKFSYNNIEYNWLIELLPGFNKSGRKRWKYDVFDTLKQNGSILDETPDVIITEIETDTEKILCAIECCSALQAGNQAWQRSGRAYSTALAECPYIYIVDFVKYELDNKTRTRKSLRFPNPLIPYSYISFSAVKNQFVSQVYVKAEEFSNQDDINIQDFDEKNFAEVDFFNYLIKIMLGENTQQEEKSMMYKAKQIVLFLSGKNKTSKNCLTKADWKELIDKNINVIDYSKKNRKFSFKKKVSKKGSYGKTDDFIELVDEYSIGISAKDMPLGIIESSERTNFVNKLIEIYPNAGITLSLADNEKDLLICILKGFKPKGDDNRPDRGLLPLAHMILGNKDIDILTFIYGPIVSENKDLLDKSPEKLAKKNGLWKTFLYLSDFLLLDAPLINKSEKEKTNNISITKFYETNRKKYLVGNTVKKLEFKVFSNIPCEYHEDDVDTGIHFLFAYSLSKYCFECMCNPPGGDWSGISILFNKTKYRWLSLPRESSTINGKRPDHIIEFKTVFEKPLLLIIESKEKLIDLEKKIGNNLINYVKSLMNFVPSVELGNDMKDDWTISKNKLSPDDFIYVSAAAYLKSEKQANDEVFKKSKCDMLIIMNPNEEGWQIELVPNPESNDAITLKKSILENYKITENSNLILK